jgi:hypothetical protein
MPLLLRARLVAVHINSQPTDLSSSFGHVALWEVKLTWVVMGSAKI